MLFLACAGLAQAEDRLSGTWESQGKVQGRGPFRGQVVITPTKHTGRYELRGAYVFAQGKPLVWSARGRRVGARLELSLQIGDAQGLAGKLGGLGGLFGSKPRGTGEYRLEGDRLPGSWRVRGLRVSDLLQRRRQSAGIDLDLVQANGKDVPEPLEELQGLAVPLNVDDDDRDGGAGGDGQVRVVSDKDDPNGTLGEDDLVPLRIRLTRPQVGARLRIRFGARVAVWRKADRTGRVRDGATLPLQDTTLFVEGLRASSPGKGEPIRLELVRGTKVLGGDSVRVHVTRAAFLLAGHGGTGDRILEQALARRALDRRRNPALVRGRDGQGRTVWWSVYSWNTERQAKIALATEGSVVVYDGHSNFGLGLAFRTHLTSVRQFMNVAEPQVSVSWKYLREHQEHPSLTISEEEYGDDLSTPEPFDPVEVPRQVRAAHGTYSVRTYPSGGGSPGARRTLTRGAQRWEDHHTGGAANPRLVVKAGSRDMPTKRWAALYLHACYSGPYYLRAFGGQGVLFFTHDRAWSNTTNTNNFLFGFVDGKDNETILRELNDEENVNDYRVFGE